MVRCLRWWVSNCSSSDDCRRRMQRRLAEQLRQRILLPLGYTNSRWCSENLSQEELGTGQHHQRRRMWLCRRSHVSKLSLTAFNNIIKARDTPSVIVGQQCLDAAHRFVAQTDGDIVGRQWRVVCRGLKAARRNVGRRLHLCSLYPFFFLLFCHPDYNLPQTGDAPAIKSISQV